MRKWGYLEEFDIIRPTEEITWLEEEIVQAIKKIRLAMHTGNKKEYKKKGQKRNYYIDYQETKGGKDERIGQRSNENYNAQ